MNFYLNECLGLDISFKGYSTKGRTNVRPHQRFDKETIKKILKIAEENSPEIYALVRLLYDMAARI